MKNIFYLIWLYIKCKWWYLLLLIASSIFVYQNRIVILDLEFEKFNSTSLVFILWIILLILPLFSEMEFFGIKLKKEVEKNKAETRERINELKAQILDLKINNSLASSQSTQINMLLPTDWEVKRTLADVSKDPEEEQKVQKVDEFVSDTSVYLFKVRLTIEKALSTICEKSSYSGIPNTHRMINYISQIGLIDQKTINYISKVNEICNRGIHGEIVSDEYLKLVEALMPKILKELNLITSRLGYKYYFVCPRCKFSGYSEIENECPNCKFISDEY